MTRLKCRLKRLYIRGSSTRKTRCSRQALSLQLPRIDKPVEDGAQYLRQGCDGRAGGIAHGLFFEAPVSERRSTVQSSEHSARARKLTFDMVCTRRSACSSLIELD